MKAKRISVSAIVGSLICLVGCSTYLVNQTPQQFPPSPDGTYTIAAEVKTNQKNIIPDSFEAFVVIDGEQFPMSREFSSNYLFVYDYKPSTEKSITRFYYVLNYMEENKNNSQSLKQIISNLHQTQLPDKLRFRLDRKRAAVDTKVSLYGDQFTDQDHVLIDGISCETTFVSTGELQFLVPEINPSFGYEVKVFTSGGLFNTGVLRVDAANPLRVLPSELELKVGQSKAIAFMLNHPAPQGGLYIDVTTDIPDSIIMPEILISESAHTISTTIQGKQIGEGYLFIKTGELPEIVVPITVR